MQTFSARIIKNLIWFSSLNAFSYVLALVSNMIIARKISIESYGVWNFALALFTIFYSMSILGICTYGTREVALDRDNIVPIARTIVGNRMLLSLAAFFIMIVFVQAAGFEPVRKKTLLILSFLLLPYIFNLEWAFQGAERIDRIFIYRIAEKTIFLVLLVFFLDSGPAYIKLPVYMLLAAILTAVWGLYIFAREFGFFIPRPEFTPKIILAGLPLGVASFMGLVNNYADTIMLGFFRSSREVGIYSASYKIVLWSISLATVIGNSLFTVLVDMRSKKPAQEFIIKFTKAVKITSFLGLASFIILFIYAEPIIKALYTDKYLEAVIVTRILSVSVLFIFVNAVFGYLLLAEGENKKYLRAVMYTAGLNVLLNAIFIPLWGVIAGAATTVISEILLFFILWRTSEKLLRGHIR